MGIVLSVCCPHFVQERAHCELAAGCLMESAPVAEDWAACSNFCGHKLVVKPKARTFFRREKLAARFSEKLFPAFSTLAAPRGAQSTDAVLMLAQLPAELCSSAPGRYGSTKQMQFLFWLLATARLTQAWLCVFAWWISVSHTGRLLLTFLHQYWCAWRCHLISQHCAHERCSCNCTFLMFRAGPEVLAMNSPSFQLHLEVVPSSAPLALPTEMRFPGSLFNNTCWSGWSSPPTEAMGSLWKKFSWDFETACYQLANPRVLALETSSAFLKWLFWLWAFLPLKYWLRKQITPPRMCCFNTMNPPLLVFYVPLL